MITVQNISKNEQTRHNECDQLDDVEIKIDRGQEHGLLQRSKSAWYAGEGLVKKTQGKSVSLYLLHRRLLAPATYI